MSTERTARRKNRYATYKKEVPKAFRGIISFADFQKGLSPEKVTEELEALLEAQKTNEAEVS